MVKTLLLDLLYCHSFLQLLDHEEEDPIYFRNFKESLRQDLSARCAANLNPDVLSKCFFFDPRYNSLKFIQDFRAFKIINASLTKNSIIEEIKDEPDTVTLEEPQDLSIHTNQPVAKKRKRFLDDDDDNK